MPALGKEVCVVKEPDIVAVEGSFLCVDGTRGRHFLEIGKDGRVFDVDEKVDDEEDIAIGRKGAFVG